MESYTGTKDLGKHDEYDVICVGAGGSAILSSMTTTFSQKNPPTKNPELPFPICSLKKLPFLGFTVDHREVENTTKRYTTYNVCVEIKITTGLYNFKVENNVKVANKEYLNIQYNFFYNNKWNLVQTRIKIFEEKNVTIKNLESYAKQNQEKILTTLSPMGFDLLQLYFGSYLTIPNFTRTKKSINYKL